MISNKQQLGFSLLEALLASSLSSLIVLAMVNLFVWSESNILQQQAITAAINKIRFINFHLQQVISMGEIRHHTDTSLEIKTKQGAIILIYFAKAYQSKKSKLPVYALFEKINSGRRDELVRPLVSMRVNNLGDKIKIIFVLRSDKKISRDHHYYYFKWSSLVHVKS